MTCANNLRQVGLALQRYIADFDCVPPSCTTTVDPVLEKVHYRGMYSVHTRLLPYLELNVLYHEINYGTGTCPPDTWKWGSKSDQERWMLAQNTTAARSKVVGFLCPSDAARLEPGCNYRINEGVGPWHLRTLRYHDSGNGLFEGFQVVGPSYVPDGMSHTAAWGERLLGSGDPERGVPARDAYEKHGPAYDADQLLLQCRAAGVKLNDTYPWMGRWWFWAGRERTHYTHAQTPNGTIPDCLTPTCETAPGMATARSHHPGGVNVGMADGSVRFVSSTIGTAAWRAMGTRNGGEIEP
jgi:prepilin-type processing-associated H-X9-DG protein